MRILLSNDDGYDSVGIIALANALKESHEIAIVAPKGQRSAFSHALTMFEPLSYAVCDGDFPIYAVNGTPADCVKFGTLSLFKNPDLVISGINMGANIGSDIIYSGTVAAAFEGAYLGVRSIAVSMVSRKVPDEYYNQAAAFIARNLDTFLGVKIDADTIISVNYPPEYRGYKVVKTGVNLYHDRYEENEKGYWLKGGPIEHDRNDGKTDVDMIKQGYATIGALTLDRNDYAALAALEKIKLV